jgi:hypothetical protein
VECEGRWLVLRRQLTIFRVIDPAAGQPLLGQVREIKS